MVELHESLSAWGTPDFQQTLKAEIERLPAAELPLQAALATTSYALDAPFTVMPISAAERGASIEARIGVFFSGITSGCSCIDDPTPVEAQGEYCEMLLTIDKATAQASFAIVPH